MLLDWLRYDKFSKTCLCIINVYYHHCQYQPSRLLSTIIIIIYFKNIIFYIEIEYQTIMFIATFVLTVILFLYLFSRSHPSPTRMESQPRSAPNPPSSRSSSKTPSWPLNASSAPRCRPATGSRDRMFGAARGIRSWTSGRTRCREPSFGTHPSRTVPRDTRSRSSSSSWFA